MKKLILLSCIIFLIENCWGTTEEGGESFFVSSRMTPKSESSLEELETRWGLGVGVGKKPVGESENGRLYIQLETRKKGDSKALWGVQIHFEDLDPQTFIQEIPKQSSSSWLLGMGIGSGIAGGIAAKLVGSVYEMLTQMDPTKNLEWIGSINKNATEWHGPQLHLGEKPYLGETQKLQLIVFGTVVGFIIPFAVRAIKVHKEAARVRFSRVLLRYNICSEVDSEESELFFQGTGENLYNDSDPKAGVKRSPLTELTDTFGSSLFYTTLSRPIAHIVDLHNSLLNIYPQPSSSSPDRSLQFNSKGISKNMFARNWNSFAILASEKCFEVPFSVDPRLEEYVNDVTLKARWSESEYPTYEAVIERILYSYDKIRAKSEMFSMNIEKVRQIGASLDNLWGYSSVTKTLKSLEEQG